MSSKTDKLRIINRHQHIREFIESAIREFNRIDGCPYLQCTECPLWDEDPSLDLCRQFLKITGKEQDGSTRKAN